MAKRLDEKRTTLTPRYTLLSPIAAGASATVYEGRGEGAVGFRRRVAIKRLHPHLATNQEMVDRFAGEARLGAHVAHPNVVATFDVVQQAHELYVVMEYVDGAALATLCERRPCPTTVAVALMRDALHGLHAAHEATRDGVSLDLIHRDVTPRNILVGRDGVARLSDFGIAKTVAPRVATEEGKVRGTLPYMAPEQLLNQAMSRSVDIYASGVVLWEIVAGRALFGGTSAEIIAAVLRGEVPSLGDLGLDAVVARATHRDPRRRFATALEMALELERLGVANRSEITRWVEGALVAPAPPLPSLPAMGAGDLDGSPRRPSTPHVTHTELPQHRPRRGVVLAVTAAAAALVVLLLHVDPIDPIDPIDPSPSSDVVAPPAAAASIGRLVESVAPPPVTATPTSATPPRVNRASPNKTTRAAPSVRSAPRSCASPTYVDEHNHVRFRRECFRD